MFTSDKRTATSAAAAAGTIRAKAVRADDSDLRTAFIYMIISIILMIAGAIYEHFSFGVYSYFMIYAFAIPLAGGALPFLAKYRLFLF